MKKKVDWSCKWGVFILQKKKRKNKMGNDQDEKEKEMEKR